jgi:tRNA-specific 2-thiouridylase
MIRFMACAEIARLNTRVVIAMSGGVDSSVAAALLKQQGYEVVGLMLRLWSEAGSENCALNRCCSPEAMDQARRVADLLDIPFYVIDAQTPFKTYVVDHLVAQYAAGLTPNPCLECNRHIRWDLLLNKALSLGAEYLATGHYARIRALPAGPANYTYQLLQGKDEKKDQSYILSVMQPAQLAHALFPVGEYTKPQVRALARELHLPVAERPESQDLCFLADGDYRRFLRQQAPEAVLPGPIIRVDGRVVGTHAGLPFYTIGQRKGIRVPGPEALYVIDLRPESNTVVVGLAAELGRDRLSAGAVNWVSGEPPRAPFRAQVKIRYKAAPAWGTVVPVPDRSVEVTFDTLRRDITPGQAAVFYDGEVCLGGGIIQKEAL